LIVSNTRAHHAPTTARLEQSIERIQKQYPNFPGEKIDEFLINWIEMGYEPENYSQAQLDEIERLTEKWVADHMRRSKASKKGKELVTLE
jgi:hypothetical protein